MTTKILENVHSLSIIKEVEKWPVLYSRNSGERGNLYFKTKVWHEVAKSVFDDWETFSEAEKDSRVNDLAKRWRNLRDTFKRQVEIEKKVREGYESKKKTYVYFKHMLFLLPHVTSEKEELNEFFEKKKGSKKKSKKIEQHFIEESEPPRVRKTDVDEIDEDRHFALSLIPTLKKMSDDDKLIAKMEILKVLRNAGRKRRKREDGPGRRRREEFEEIAPVKMEFINTEEEMEEVVESDSVDDSD